MASITVLSGGLTRRVLRGDRVRIKSERVANYRAGYDFEPTQTFTVVRGPDVEGRLVIDAPPPHGLAV